MPISHPATPKVVPFIQTCINRRAVNYRERATKLLALADTEPVGSLRHALRALAGRYEELAAGLELPHIGRSESLPEDRGRTPSAPVRPGRLRDAAD